MKSTESERGIPRKARITVFAGVLPVYVLAFVLVDETNKSIDKKETIIFICCFI
jgi:hypothetical protein